MIDKYHANGHGKYNQLGYIQETVTLVVANPKMSLMAKTQSVMFWVIVISGILVMLAIMIAGGV